jgi:hypothetical protein
MSQIKGKWIHKDSDNLTYSGDDLKVKFSDNEAADGNKVWSSEKINTISGSLSSQIPSDYYTTGEVDTISGVLSSEIDSDISTHASSGDHDGRYYTETELNDGQLDSRYYTESEVDTISGALNGKISSAGVIDKVEYITVSSGDISNKYTVLAHTPYSVTEVACDVIGGCSQLYGTDYTVSGTHLSWNGLGLDGVLAENDQMRVFYTYN